MIQRAVSGATKTWASPREDILASFPLNVELPGHFTKACLDVIVLREMGGQGGRSAVQETEPQSSLTGRGTNCGAEG